MCANPHCEQPSVGKFCNSLCSRAAARSRGLLSPAVAGGWIEGPEGEWRQGKIPLDLPFMADMALAWRNQRNECEICGWRPEDPEKWALVNDHNHVTGHLRGHICNSCNSGGPIDRTEFAEKHYAYTLRQPGWWQEVLSADDYREVIRWYLSEGGWESAIDYDYFFRAMGFAPAEALF